MNLNQQARQARILAGSFVSVLSLICLLTPARAAGGDDSSAKVDAVFHSFAPDAPGCVCAVMQDGRMVYAKAFGMADLEHAVPLTVDSVFNIGSMSKQFTAASVALLALDGKLSLTDDIRKYFPELPDYGDPITVDELIHHTSGIRDCVLLVEWSGWNGIDVIDNQRIIRLLARQRALNYKPGTRYIYTNSEYILLSELVHRISGQTLPEFAAERIFRPLGMDHTLIDVDPTEIVPNRAMSYKKTGTSYRQFVDTEECSGDSKVLSTVGDLAKWDENFYTGKVGGPAFLKMMLTTGVSLDGKPVSAGLSEGKPTEYAFGLMKETLFGLTAWEHNGRQYGFRSDMIRFPDRHLSVTVLANSGIDDVTDLAKQVAAIYLNVTPATHPTPQTVPHIAVQIDPKVFDAYAGWYSSDDSAYIAQFWREDGNFYLQILGGGPRVNLYPSSETDFFRKDANVVFTFHREADGTVRQVTRADNGVVVRYLARMKSAPPSPPPLTDYVGKYASEEIGVTYEVNVIDGKLFESSDASPPNQIPRKGGDVFSSAETTFRFRRDTKGSVNGLSLSGSGVLDLEFVRQGER